MTHLTLSLDLVSFWVAKCISKIWSELFYSRKQLFCSAASYPSNQPWSTLTASDLILMLVKHRLDALFLFALDTVHVSVSNSSIVFVLWLILSLSLFFLSFFFLHLDYRSKCQHLPLSNSHDSWSAGWWLFLAFRPHSCEGKGDNQSLLVEGGKVFAQLSNSRAKVTEDNTDCSQ